MADDSISDGTSVYGSPTCPECGALATGNGERYYRAYECPDCSESWTSAR